MVSWENGLSDLRTGQILSDRFKLVCLSSLRSPQCFNTRSSKWFLFENWKFFILKLKKNYFKKLKFWIFMKYPVNNFQNPRNKFRQKLVFVRFAKITTFVESVWKLKFKSEKMGSKENWTFAESNFFRPQKFSKMLWSVLLSPARWFKSTIFVIMNLIFTAIKSVL